MTSADRFSIAGRTAIVTGASRGIGRGIASCLGALNANVVAFARGEAALADAVTQFPTGRALAVAGDVTSPEDLQRAVDMACKHFGTLDVFCHCAGIYPAAPIADIGLAEWHRVVDTNLTSTFLAVKACAPAMRRRQYGRIVLISSITGPRTGFPGWAHYGATKAGMEGFMRTAALELAPSNITINAIEPGSILTEGLEAVGEDKIKAMVKHIPAGSIGQPDDIGWAVAFLASEAARFITGQTLVVDGGQTLPEIPE